VYRASTNAAAMTASKRALIANLGIALVATAVTGEAVLRVYDSVRPSGIFYKTSYDRFRPNPHAQVFAFELNSMGFKDVEFRREKGDAYRIVALGDSFAFAGVPYGSGFLELVEEQLHERGRQIEILNFGVPAIGPWQYLDLLVDEALDFDPDGVLLCFYVGNDILNARNQRRKLYEYSHFASLIHFLVVHRAALPDRPFSHHQLGPLEYVDDTPTVLDAQFLNLERDRSYIYRIGNPRFDRDLQAAMQALIGIQRVCRERGIPLLVVLLPAEIQVDPALQAEVRETVEGDAAIRWDFSRPSRALSAALAEAGIAHLDLYEQFASAAKTRRLYKPRDTHWNLAGNRLAAGVLGDFLAARGAGKSSEATGP
jgi:hypothetical protein